MSADAHNQPPVPGAGPPAPPGLQPAAPRLGLRQALLYPGPYLWYVLLATLDVLLTRLILHLGGQEMNWIADWILRRFDLPGVVAFKFALLVVVVLACELAGRRDRQAGLKLARWAVVITAFPVVVALVLLVGRLSEFLD